jgi:hypothetical protein
MGCNGQQNPSTKKTILLTSSKHFNRKGTTSQPEIFPKLVSGDIQHGYALPLPLEKNTQIPHVYMAPLNIQPQWTINQCGEIVEKNCSTHDQSFEWKELPYRPVFKHQLMFPDVTV